MIVVMKESLFADGWLFWGGKFVEPLFHGGTGHATSLCTVVVSAWPGGALSGVPEEQAVA